MTCRVTFSEKLPVFDELVADFRKIVERKRVLDAGQLFPSSHVWNDRPSFHRNQFADLLNFNKRIKWHITWSDRFKIIRQVHTSNGIGSGVEIGSVRSVTIQCKSKNGIGSRVGSSTETESEGSEEFRFLLIPLPLPSLPIQWEQGERNQKQKRNYQPIKKLITSPF